MSEEWDAQLALFGYKCVYCGNDWEHIDHLIPRSMGGSNDIENLVPSCARCNQQKGPMHPIDFVDMITGEKQNER